MYISSISDCQCPFLEIILANDVLAKNNGRQGTYEIFETKNGKPHWKSAAAAHAIWYYQQSKAWLIGRNSDIGTGTAFIRSLADTENDCPEKVPKDKWIYWDGSGWQEASSNDIIIQCTGKKDPGMKYFFKGISCKSNKSIFSIIFRKLCVVNMVQLFRMFQNLWSWIKI